MPTFTFKTLCINEAKSAFHLQSIALKSIGEQPFPPCNEESKEHLSDLKNVYSSHDGFFLQFNNGNVYFVGLPKLSSQEGNGEQKLEDFQISESNEKFVSLPALVINESFLFKETDKRMKIFSAGPSHIAYVTAAGILYLNGRDAVEQLGAPEVDDVKQEEEGPVEIEVPATHFNNEKILSVKCLAAGTVLQTETGSIYGMVNQNSMGSFEVLGITPKPERLPVYHVTVPEEAVNKRIQKIVFSNTSSCFLINNRLYGAGRNVLREATVFTIEAGTTNLSRIYLQSNPEMKFWDVAVTDREIVALASDGSVHHSTYGSFIPKYPVENVEFLASAKDKFALVEVCNNVKRIRQVNDWSLEVEGTPLEEEFIVCDRKDSKWRVKTVSSSYKMLLVLYERDLLLFSRAKTVAYMDLSIITGP